MKWLCSKIEWFRFSGRGVVIVLVVLVVMVVVIVTKCASVVVNWTIITIPVGFYFLQSCSNGSSLWLLGISAYLFRVVNVFVFYITLVSMVLWNIRRKTFHREDKRKGKERKSIYIAPFCTKVHSKRSGVDHTVLPANNAFPSWRSPDVATTATAAADIQLQLTTHLSTPKGWKAELA